MLTKYPKKNTNVWGFQIKSSKQFPSFSVVLLFLKMRVGHTRIVEAYRLLSYQCVSCHFHLITIRLFCIGGCCPCCVALEDLGQQPSVIWKPILHRQLSCQETILNCTYYHSSFKGFCDIDFSVLIRALALSSFIAAADLSLRSLSLKSFSPFSLEISLTLLTHLLFQV